MQSNAVPPSSVIEGAITAPIPVIKTSVASINVQQSSLQQLPRILPLLLDRLSISRAQIIVDQIRSAVEDGAEESVTLLTASTSTSDNSANMDSSDAQQDHPRVQKVIAAAILLEPTPKKEELARSQDSSQGNNDDLFAKSDSATLLHAGSISDSSHVQSPDPNVIQALRQTLDQMLREKGITFVQWATDTPPPSELPDPWRSGLGFQWAADLEYLTAEIDPLLLRHTTMPRELKLTPLDWTDSSRASWHGFAKIVESTYIATLDCPGLLDYRTAEQTLTGYRQSPAFESGFWFTVSLRKQPKRLDPPISEPVGAIVMARHGDRVAELVYMGVAPAFRGRGLGEAMVQSVFAVANHVGAERLILAVDQGNHYARRLYHRFGLRCLMNESVSVKRIER